MSTVAVVPAYNRADRIMATVSALRSVAEIDDVVVVDDGSTDDTASKARLAGARVLRLDHNVGKGGAVAAGLGDIDGFSVVVLIDSDTAGTAVEASVLIAPIIRGEADMTVAILPDAGRRGGFGLVRDVAAAGLKKATGLEFSSPLSGQRAIRKDTIDGIELAPRFGLEAGLTIDVIAAGGRVLEVETSFDHRHTGRSVAGFRHRFRQGRDLIGALGPRLGWIPTVQVVVTSLWGRVRR